MKSLTLAFFLSVLFTPSIGQDTQYVRQIIDSLCSPVYHGRGYVKRGDSKAINFMMRELRKLNGSARLGVITFEMQANTFPGALSVELNNNVLSTGEDFIIDPISGGAHGEVTAVYFKTKWAKSEEELFAQIANGRFEGKVVVFDEGAKNSNYAQLISDVRQDPLKAAGYMILTEKPLTWSVSNSFLQIPILSVRKEAYKKKIKRVTLNIDQEYLTNHRTANLMATIPGTDTAGKKMRVYTAHLDHLGRMGSEVYIAGANDNASGSAMLLDIYKYYLQNPPEFEVRFIWFSGEEAGLVGSQYFVDNSPIDLSKIGFLMNLDLMGDAGKGVTAVNGKVLEEHFAKLSSINMEMGLVEQVKARGPAANSDHHPFHEKGVPCFFIYTMGDYNHYHDINDVPENLPLTNYSEVFKLIVEFMEIGV